MKPETQNHSFQQFVEDQAWIRARKIDEKCCEALELDLDLVRERISGRFKGYWTQYYRVKFKHRIEIRSFTYKSDTEIFLDGELYASIK